MRAILAMVLAALLMAAAGLALVEPASDRRVRRLMRSNDGSPWWTGIVGRLKSRSWPGPAHRRRRAADRMRTVHALSALAAELEAGQPPHAALQRCADDPPVWPHALAAMRVDADVPDALRVDARERPVLAQLAACWRVASESGAGEL